MTGPTPSGDSWSDFVGGRADPDRTGSGGTLRGHPLQDLAAGEAFSVPPAAPPAPKALIGRFTVSLAGLLAAGCLVLGLGLVALMIVAPRTGGTGVAAPTGPGWTRTMWHLAVGAGGEAARQLTRRQQWPVRVAVAVVVIAATVAVLARSWWF